nr:augmin subunit 5 [Quercus suber]
MIHDGGVVAAELSKVVAGAPQLITIGTDKTLTIWDTISFKVWAKEREAAGSELETIYTALLKANVDIATFWNQQPLAARESSAFYQSRDNSLYILPSNPQALLGSMGANGSTGPEAVAAVEKNAALLTARAGSRDLSVIPSICCVSPALECAVGEFWSLI